MEHATFGLLPLGFRDVVECWRYMSFCDGGDTYLMLNTTCVMPESDGDAGHGEAESSCGPDFRGQIGEREINSRRQSISAAKPVVALWLLPISGSRRGHDRDLYISKLPGRTERNQVKG